MRRGRGATRPARPRYPSPMALAHAPLPRLITFDLDDTLWDIEAVVAEAERRLHAWFAVHHPAVAARHTPADLRRLRDEAPQRHPELVEDMTALRKRSLERAF